MTDALWNGMQHISDEWIVKADEDAVKKHFQNNTFRDAAEKNDIIEFPSQREKQRSRKGFRWATLAACACLCLCAVTIFRQSGSREGTPPKMTEAIMEVSSSAEMADYLGFSVPVLENKNASAYMLYASGEYAEKGSVVYDDGSIFEITTEDKTETKNVYGAETISGIVVQYGSEDGHLYAAWTCQGYSCRYYDYDVGSSSTLSHGESTDAAGYKDEISSLIIQMQ